MYKKHLQKISSRGMLGGLIVICIGILGAAYVLENYFSVLPCQMCLYERNVFMVIGGLAFLSLFVPLRAQHYAIFILGIIFMMGALLAAYHVAIQQHWVGLPGFCAANDFSSFDSVEALREQMLKTPFVRCDKVTWSLFGLSLAAYNALLSFVLGLGCWVWGWAQK